MAKLNSIVVSLLLFASAALVSAIPNVTVTQIDAGTCAGFPNYYAAPGSDYTQPFLITPDQADNSSVNGLYTSEDNHEIVIAINPQLARILYSCSNAVLQEYPTGNEVSLSTDPNYQVLVAYSTEGLKPEAYTHAVDGVQQAGVFLGHANVTTWAFKFLPGSGGAGSEDFFGVRLLAGSNTTLGDGEFKGFLKLEAA